MTPYKVTRTRTAIGRTILSNYRTNSAFLVETLHLDTIALVVFAQHCAAVLSVYDKKSSINRRGSTSLLIQKQVKSNLSFTDKHGTINAIKTYVLY